MANYIGGTGVALPTPGALYPSTVLSLPAAVGTNGVSLIPGGEVIIPPGRFMVSPGQYCVVQIKDPVTQTWLPYSTFGANEPIVLDSDGQNYRVYNPLGFPIGAVVTNSGNGYTSAPTIAASVGGSTWTAIVGGAVFAINVNSGANAAGVNYAVPPIVNVSAPPSPGVQATAVCAISGGTVTTFTIVNPGAGYTAPPTVTLVPQQSDLNFFPASTSSTQTVNATATAVLSFNAQLTAVLLTNEGNNPLPISPALTFTGGGGTNAAATAVMAYTVTAVAVTSGGTNYPATSAITSAGGSIFTQTSGIGGAPLVSSQIVGSGLLPVPRPLQMSATQGSATGVQPGLIIDGGMFTAAPVVYAVPPGQGALFSTTLGSVNDTVYLTPL